MVHQTNTRQMLRRALWLAVFAPCFNVSWPAALAVEPAAATPKPTGGDERRPITDLIPADALVMYRAQPYSWLDQPAAAAAGSSSQPASTAASIASIVSLLNAAGLIPDEGQVFADIAGALPLLAQFEHAMVLLDISSRIVEQGPDDDADGGEVEVSLRLQRMQAAVLFRTGDRHRLVLDQLNRVIGRYTNNEVARLEPGRHGAYRFERLSDQRLPGWAIWEWGRVGEFFVLSFGTGAFANVVDVATGKEASLTSDGWYRRADRETRGDVLFAQWMIAFARLERSLGPQAGGRFEAVAQALQAAEIDKDLWTVGAEGRRLSCLRYYEAGGKSELRRYSDPRAFPESHLKIVPEHARHVAVVSVPTRWLVDNLPRAWLAAQSVSNVQKWRRAWRQLERDSGVDISESLISHFGQSIVLYDYPPHPLKIPFAVTLAIEIDDPRAVKAATDAILDAWTRYLDERAERNKTTLVRIKVLRDPDNVWYLQAGILGPAMKVTDRYVVISWSPQALRECLRYVEKADGPAASP